MSCLICFNCGRCEREAILAEIDLKALKRKVKLEVGKDIGDHPDRIVLYDKDFDPFCSNRKCNDSCPLNNIKQGRLTCNHIWAEISEKLKGNYDN